jgi:hypothetical protein
MVVPQRSDGDVSITASLWVLYNLFMERKMPKSKREQLKAEFKQALKGFVGTFKGHISTSDNQWTVKGFIDVFRNIYTISADTKIVSKILEIHLFSDVARICQSKQLSNCSCRTAELLP